jgi:prepilin-type N-terminal cleavage/methylation domain-containing protein
MENPEKIRLFQSKSSTSNQLARKILGRISIPSMKRPLRLSFDSAFTLVELLVVISIIAILAGFAMPAFTKAMEQADRTKVLNDGKQIALSMKNYAGDFGGEFPFYTDPIRKQGQPQSANDILATLIPDYIPNEQVFTIKKSGYCRPGADGNITAGRILERGENGWAYVLGLTDTSNGRWPLLAPGFKNGGVTYITNDESAPGGLWRGEYSVVIRADLSGQPEKCMKQRTGGTEAWVRRDGNDPNKNAFQQEQSGDQPWLAGRDIRVLNPQPR